MLSYDALEPPLTGDWVDIIMDRIELYFGVLTTEVHNGAFTNLKQPWDFYPKIRTMGDKAGKVPKNKDGKPMTVEEMKAAEKRNQLTFYAIRRQTEFAYIQERERKAKGGVG